MNNLFRNLLEFNAKSHLGKDVVALGAFGNKIAMFVIKDKVKIEIATYLILNTRRTGNNIVVGKSVGRKRRSSSLGLIFDAQSPNRPNRSEKIRTDAS